MFEHQQFVKDVCFLFLGKFIGEVFILNEFQSLIVIGFVCLEVEVGCSP